MCWCNAENAAAGSGEVRLVHRVQVEVTDAVFHEPLALLGSDGCCNQLSNFGCIVEVGEQIVHPLGDRVVPQRSEKR